jgi:hypothetical protein
MTHPKYLLRPEHSYSHRRGPFSRLLSSLHHLRHQETLFEEAGPSSQVTNVPERSASYPWEIEDLLDHVHNHLRPQLPESCKWLEQEALEIDTERPIDAGGAADILVTRIGNRDVAVKSYRLYSSSSYLPTCEVSRTYIYSKCSLI